MARLEDLGEAGDRKVDNRWTCTKLYQAGYEEIWQRDCLTCGDEIACWKHRATGRVLLLNDPVLDPHCCEGP